jgi:hypothetical protein
MRWLHRVRLSHRRGADVTRTGAGEHLGQGRRRTGSRRARDVDSRLGSAGGEGRINTPEYNAKGAATGPNRAAFNFGGDVRVDYRLGDSPFSVGDALWGADPFGINGGNVGCNVGGELSVHQSPALCSKNNAGIDNSLPGYALETLEYYVKYSDRAATITVGNQLLDKPWEPASDSRIKPSLYQGADATINVSKALAIGLTRITRFDNRTESIFDQCTLLTCPPGATPAGIGSIVGLIAIASEAAYNYDTAFARNRTYEFDADVTYNFNAVRAGAYRGLSLRERFADRTQPTLPYNFKYLRHQLQYSF